MTGDLLGLARLLAKTWNRGSGSSALEIQAADSAAAEIINGKPPVEVAVGGLLLWQGKVYGIVAAGTSPTWKTLEIRAYPVEEASL